MLYPHLAQVSQSAVVSRRDTAISSWVCAHASLAKWEQTALERCAALSALTLMVIAIRTWDLVCATKVFMGSSANIECVHMSVENKRNLESVIQRQVNAIASLVAKVWVAG